MNWNRGIDAMPERYKQLLAQASFGAALLASGAIGAALGLALGVLVDGVSGIFLSG